MRKKNRLPPFVAIRKDLLNDKEWRKLSSSAKVLYVYLRGKFNYKTLSEVSLSYSEMKDMMSSQTMSNALKELTQAKFIEKTKHGGLWGGVCLYKFNGQFKDFVFRGSKL